MEVNTTTETFSTNDSQDMSSSQHASTASDGGPYGFDEGNSTSSLQESPQDEVVNSAIMEVSGELMLGKFRPHKQPSGGSESSDISDDDGRRGLGGGSIAKYPESSTGLSDNDWNPYATESDTNQTPRSPRSNTSDEPNRPGFISKATFNFSGPQSKSDTSTATVSMTTGEVTLDKNRHAGADQGEKLGILRYMIDDGGKKEAEVTHQEDHESDRDTVCASMDSARYSGRNGDRDDEEVRTETPDTVRSLHADGSKSDRQSIESERSDDFRRVSAESGKSFQTESSGRSFGRFSTESDRSDSCRSGRQSTESGRSDQSLRYNVDRSGEAEALGRQSTESYQSVKSNHSRQSDQSEQSQKSTGRSCESDRSDRLDRLHAVGDNMKDLIEFESSQRAVPKLKENNNAAANDFPKADLESGKQDGSNESVTRIRLTARLEPYSNPVKSAASPELSANKFSGSSYVSVAERQRLLSDSPDLVGGHSAGLNGASENEVSRKPSNDQAEYMSQMDKRRPAPSAVNMPSMADRFPNDVSLKRVSDLFEETKRQARAAVSIPRPEPSGSEERFPLKERLDWSHHEESFLSQNKQPSERSDGKFERSRDSETARSITSEEVARVLGKYADEDEASNGRHRPTSDSQVKTSAFDKIDPVDSGMESYRPRSRGSSGLADSMKTGEMSDDEIARRVKAILSDSNHYGVVGGNGANIQKENASSSSKTDYVPRTIDYSRLQRDLQDIQDNLHDVPESRANDSLHVQKRNIRDRNDESSPVDDRDPCKSLETTGSIGRESAASEFGRKLVWDHGADINYDTGYRGEFMGTDTNTGTLSSRRYGTGDSDTLRYRPDSAATDVTLGDLDTDTVRSSTDITRAEKIVKQVMNRRAEGNLEENVEDIIAKYRNERQDLFDKLQKENDIQSNPLQKESEASSTKFRPRPDQLKYDKESGAVPRASDLATANYEDVARELSEKLKPGQKPSLAELGLKVSGLTNDKPASPLRKPVASPLQNGRKEPGLAERVYKILTSDPNEDPIADAQDEKGMAKEVYKILAKDRPQEQVNGILSTAMEEEHEMLKKITSEAANEDTSMDDSGLNGSVDSSFLEGKDIRKQLEWSLMSSPDKADKTGVSDYTAIRKVTSAPYSSVSNAKTLLSSQLKKMTERNFDKSVELRTPYRQAIACYPVYGMEKDEAGKDDQDGKPGRERQGAVRETWKPGDRAVEGSARQERDLASDRFFITDKDRASRHVDVAGGSPRHQRRLSDPFSVTPASRELPPNRDHHTRSRSEEAANVSQFSDYSFHEPRPSPSVTDRRSASSPKRMGSEHDAGTLMTPDQHKPQEWSCECYTSRSDSSDPRYHSDSSGCHGNLLYDHGYQMEKTRDPENDLYSPYERIPRTAANREQGTKSHLSDEERLRSLPIEREQSNQSPVKMMNKKTGRQSRSRIRHRRGQTVNRPPMSRSLPNYYPERGFFEEVPFSRDDVYDLLTRSEAQEVKLAELQRKLHEQHGLGLSLPPTGNHGYELYTHAQGRGSFRSQHQHSRGGGSPSATESDTSSSRKGTRLRPYRPSGSRDVYYTESGDDTNESGTTVESTHPGSDDAVPPYIPKQFLGSRQDEPTKHPTGIYGIPVSQDVLSTIDEQSAKDEKEKALSVSTGSVKEDPDRPDDVRVGRRSPYSQTDIQTTTRTGAMDSRINDNGIQSTSVRDPTPPGSQGAAVRGASTGYQATTGRSNSPYSSGRTELRSRSPHGDMKDDKAMYLPEYQRFKTREEFKAEFERQERELKDVLAGRTTSGTGRAETRDHRWAGTRSEREPVEQLGASVRSDPGEMFDSAGARWENRESDGHEFRRLEPESPYPQDRLRYSRSRSDTDLTAMSPAESQRYSSPMQPGTRFLELSNQPSPISHHNSITYQPGQVAGAPRERTTRDQPAELPRVPVAREQAHYLPSRVDDRRSPGVPLDLPASDVQPVRPLEPGDVPLRPLEPGRSQGQPRPVDLLEQVELGADPRRMGGIRPRDRSRSPPLQMRQKKMEEELTKINKDLSEQVNAIQGKETPQPEVEEFEDNFPPSKKAQVLREVLEQEYMDTVPPNINDMWTRFKEKREQSLSESSLNSTRLDALSGLLNNPTKHKVNSAVKETGKQSEKKRKEVVDEKVRDEEQYKRAEDRKTEEKAAEKRSKRRHEARQRHGLSEEESNGSYTEILMETERRKEREKRNAKKEARAERKSKSPKKSRTDQDPEMKTDKGTATEISSKVRGGRAQLSDTADTLFSIPEDASVENTPCKAESELRSRQRRQRHVIDPLMSKLRDKIKLQRDKIDKERRKELQRVEKLKKLEMLLKAKRKGKLSDKAINVELQDVSSTTSVSQGSESSQVFSDTTVASSVSESENSSTLIDSTADTIKLQVKKYPVEAFVSPKKAYVESDSTESSDFSNIVVERLKEGKAEKKSPVERGRKSASKPKKVRVDEFGNKIKKGKKDKKKQEIYGVEMDEKILAKQLHNYNQYMSPDRRSRRTREVGTMYPSPITVSPPTRRRLRDVMMKSEAIQTSPSVRSSSPSHAYEEVPVAPVPLMSERYSKSSRRRPSPSPTRTIQSSPLRKSSKSPASQRTSKAPSTTRTSSKSPVRSAPPIPRKLVESPMWKPEKDTTPPHNSMFTPEDSDENRLPNADKKSTQAWFIPMKPSKPWRQPFKERQAFAVSKETWEPQSISQTKWKDIVHGDVLKEKGDPNDVSRDTKFDLDPDGQPVGDENTDDSDDSDLDVSRSKPLSKMTLQEAFQQKKVETISRLRERQKRLNLAAEERKMEAFLKMERDRLFHEERRKEANPEAHPYSDNLYKPARRVISKEEMKEMTIKRYKKLPEVIEQEKLKKRQEEYSLNRLKARLFNRKMQKKILVKAEKWGR